MGGMKGDLTDWLWFTLILIAAIFLHATLYMLLQAPLTL